MLIPSLAWIILAWSANTVAAQVDIPSFIGLWCPRPGSSAIYQVADQLSEVDQISIGASEVEVEGKPRLEIRTEYRGLDHHIITQEFSALILIPPMPGYPLDGLILERVRAQEPGLTPRDLPPELRRGGGKPILAEQVGTSISKDEKIQVAAGLFHCEHYKIKDADVWLTPKISPYGVICYKSPGFSMQLQSYQDGAAR